jgi:hypothetical protein
MRDITNAIGFCHIACSIRPIQRTEPSQGKTPQDAFETRHNSGKTGKIVVDYNGAKVPWAPKTRIYTSEGKIRGADIVWDTYPSLDVQQRAPEIDSQYESQIDRYS